VNASTQQVWERFSGELKGFLVRRVNDADTADDLLQDVFVRVHTGLDQLRAEERIAPWVFRIARNVLADHYRRRRPAGGGQAELLAIPDGDDVAAGEPQVVAARDRIGNYLAGLVDALPETYRDAVRLAEVDGLTQAEVGERLGLSLSGAKSRVQRGRAILRERLLDCCHFEFDRRQRVIAYEPRPRCCASCRSSGC
jgi:RNA polymerase sigma-70 factor (ECF subfamily)